MNINRRIDGVEMETKYLRDRRKPTPTTFEDVGLSLNQTESIQSINTTDTSYNFTNNSTLLGDGSDANPYSESDVLWTVLAPMFLVVFCVFGQRANVPSSQYHRGEMIRRQAERVWAIQRVKDERQAIPTETRKEQIEEGLRRMKIVSKCSKTGYCVLGEVEDEEQNEKQHDDDKDPSSAADEDKRTANDESIGVAENEAPSPLAPMASPAATATSSGSKSTNISCPESPGSTERKPLLSADSEDSEDDFGSTEGKTELSKPSTNNGATTNSYPSYDFEDDEDVCPICLDNFEVEDTVMFSRHNEGSCSHVFHEECLLQWLLEQRENECPTCRACFIADLESNSIASSSSSATAETNENSIIVESDEEITSSSESNADIEEDNSRNDATTNDETNTGGDCNFDLDEMQNEDDDGEGDEKEDTTAIDEVEEDFTYIIVKGSVQRLPLSHDS